MDDLRGRVAVVTGAASGIGLGLAQRFAAEGMRVVLADVEEGALDAAVEQLRSAGAEAVGLRTDVTDPEQVATLAALAVERFGAVHVVCNNAGVVTMGPVWEQTLEDWRWVVGVDLWGVIHGVRTFVPLLLAQGGDGHVVNTSSIAGLLASPGIGPYNVAKFGVVALSETLLHDLRAAGSSIGVSVLCPGVVPTRIAASGRNRPGGATGPLDIPTQDELPPTALSAEDVAGRVVDAIRDDEFWIVTHEGSFDLVAERAAGMAKGEAPVPPPVF